MKMKVKVKMEVKMKMNMEVKVKMIIGTHRHHHRCCQRLLLLLRPPLPPPSLPPPPFLSPPLVVDFSQSPLPSPSLSPPLLPLSLLVDCCICPLCLPPLLPSSPMPSSSLPPLPVESNQEEAGPAGLSDPPPCNLACLDHREKTSGILLPILHEDSIRDDIPGGRHPWTVAPYPLPLCRLVAVLVPRRCRRQHCDDDDPVPTAIPATPSQTQTLLLRLMLRWKPRNLTCTP